MSLINFKAIYEKLFSSFDVSADSKLVQDLEKEWINQMMIIKRSWLFWISILWMFIFILILSAINIFLILNDVTDTNTSYTLVCILWISLLLWIFSVILYFIKFRLIYWKKHTTIPVQELIIKLQGWDKAFTQFFNQTLLNYLILIWIAAYILYYLIFIKWFSDFWYYWWLSIILLFLQIYFSAKFKKRMTDLEMDFSVVIPGKIIFYNQSGILRNIVSINAEKVKTITAKFNNFIGSIFNYWDITIFTEWDSADMWEMNLFFVSNPTEVVYEINEILGKHVEWENNK